ncbi:hypothetical protein C4J93_1359 [Pseudomonas sp. R2-37-08W]|nr:hypothetical protein C4J93_1359 [Pseudomonas sp. R2-37-08W]
MKAQRYYGTAVLGYWHSIHAGCLARSGLQLVFPSGVSQDDNL